MNNSRRINIVSMVRKNSSRRVGLRDCSNPLF